MKTHEKRFTLALIPFGLGISGSRGITGTRNGLFPD
jgi:hypothetical protein